MKKIIIIGAGPAGITAAFQLLKNTKDEYEIIILEESNEIGGISRTVRYNGNRMDIGGHRFFSKDDNVMKWWAGIMPTQGADAYDDKILGRKKALVENGPDPEKDDEVMLIRNRVSRIYYKKKFFDYPISLKWETIKNMGFFTTICAGFSYLKACVFKKKETSLENFYINRFGRKLYSMFFEGYTEKLWGRHPREISADWGAQRVKGLSIVAIIKDVFSKIFKKNSQNKKVETSLIEEFYYPKYGPGQLWEVAAGKVENMGGSIIKNAKVVKINNLDGKIRSVVYEKAGEQVELEGDIFISSMPLKDLTAGMNSVPENIAAIAKGLPYRDFVTVGLLVDKKFYGRVYASMGAAYGHQFLYKEAAKAYQEAYKICEQPDMLKAYLYSCYRALPHEEYIKLLSGNPVLLSLDTVIQNEIDQTKKEIGLDIPEEKLEEWKKEYRRIDKHRRI